MPRLTSPLELDTCCLLFTAKLVAGTRRFFILIVQLEFYTYPMHMLQEWSSSLPLCCILCLVTQSCLTLCDPHGLQPIRLLLPWDSPSKNTRAGCHALLQGIFPTQGSNPGLPHCRWILYHLSQQGSPPMQVPFTCGSSWTEIISCPFLMITNYCFVSMQNPQD